SNQLKLNEIYVKIDSLDTLSAEIPIPEKKKGFFNKLFGKSKPVEIPIDTGPSKLQEVKMALEELQVNSAENTAKYHKRELYLLKEHNNVKEALASLLDKVEIKEQKKIQEDIAKAENRTYEIYQGIFLFCASIIFFLIINIVLIFNYIRKSKKYLKAFNEARVQALRSKKEQENLASSISHEIRNPLNAISGYSKLLQSGNSKSSEVKEHLEIIKNTSDYLINVVNDVLDYTKSNTRKLHLQEETFDLNEVIEDVSKIFFLQAKSKGLDYKTSLPQGAHWVKGDKIRIQQILTNLISNAVKYTSEGKIEIQLHLEKKEQNYRAQIAVIDSGRGMNEEQLKSLFKSFTQFQDDVGQSSGLGLTITKRLVDLLGGKLEVESTPQEGSKFVFDIALKVGKSNKNTDTQINTSQSTFLVVDDEHYNVELLRKMLKPIAKDVLVAMNRQEAHRITTNNEIDFALLDMNLPDTDGLTLGLELRNIKKDIKLIAISGSDNNNLKTKVKEAGFLEFFLKPFKLEELIDLLNLNSNLRSPDMNLAGLDEMSKTDPQFALEMCELFTKTLNEGLENLASALKRKDLDNMKEIAHKNVSPSRHIGAQKLTEYFKEIENFTGKAPDEYLSKTLKNLNTEADRVKKYVLDFSERLSIELSQ
ncbi:MAG: ATP-binding protein, partial [Flavobacteriales bacterium]|nr:ATP-binding protein [Flavobacteriales bacterium]